MWSGDIRVKVGNYICNIMVGITFDLKQAHTRNKPIKNGQSQTRQNQNLKPTQHIAPPCGRIVVLPAPFYRCIPANPHRDGDKGYRKLC